jgi:hypothetical protein
MAFPQTPTNGQTYTNDGGTLFQYSASDNKWRIVGTTGIMGVQGVTGVAGVAGDTGVEGVDGATGVAGVNGATGLAGAAGAQGATGVAGTQGATGAAGSAGVSYYRNASSWTTSSATLAGISGMAFAVEANKLYIAEFTIFCSNANNGDFMYDVTGPSSVDAIGFEVEREGGSGNPSFAEYKTGLSSLTSNSYSATAGYYHRIRMSVDTNANAGTIQLRARLTSESSGRTSTVLAGSYFIVGVATSV